MDRALRSAQVPYLSAFLSWLLEVVHQNAWQWYATVAALFLSTVIFEIACVLPTWLMYQPPEACKKLGLEAASNLADEHKHIYHRRNQEARDCRWYIKSLWVFPIKSCKGVELEDVTVTSRGMKYDRAFTFAVSQTAGMTKKNHLPTSAWRFLTQRQVPALATVRTEIWAPDPDAALYSSQHPNVLSEGVVVLKWRPVRWHRLCRGPEMSAILPYKPTGEQIKQNAYEEHMIDMWDDRPTSMLVAGTERVGKSNAWVHELKTYLQQESRRQNPGFQYDLDRPFALFMQIDQLPREVYRNAPKKQVAGYQPVVGFQDAYPLHLLNIASVRDVEGKLVHKCPPLKAINFRSNIIVSGGEAYAEDAWRLISIGGHIHHVTSRTSRCLLPNVDQITGKRDRNEPSKTLDKHRKIDAGCPQNSCLGMHVVPGVEHEIGIKVGDTLEVLEEGAHHYITAQESMRLRGRVQV